LSSQGKKRIIVSVTTDLVSDNRVYKTCNTLYESGFEVLLVGRLLPYSLSLSPRSYPVIRMKLFFRKGPMFYFCYNTRLLFLLLFSRFDLLLSNDLDTLPANFIASKLKGKPLIYDSHEFFTEVPELSGRPFVKSVWEWLEKLMVPRLKYAYTVCDSIAGIYTEKYNVNFRVVRNFPLSAQYENILDSESSADKFILYQGAVNMGRGLEQAIRAMRYLECVRLVVAGDGDKLDELKEIAVREGVQNKVQFLGRLPIGELSRLTPQASLGLSIEEDKGLNYRYALPNKLFDYIQANVPVLVSDLPEMVRIVRTYKVGEVISSLDPENLSTFFREMLTNKKKREFWKENLVRAAQVLTWENESARLKEIFDPLNTNEKK